MTGPEAGTGRPERGPRRFLFDVFTASVDAASPHACLPGHWPSPPAGRMAVLAVGKAAAAMAEAAERHYGSGIEGLVLTPDGHAGRASLSPGMRLMQSSHPVPDSRSVLAAEAALELASRLGPDDLLLVLLSGGGSSVMCKPKRGVSLAAKQSLTQALHRSGATIKEINCVRAHLSSIKSGQLAAAARSPLVTLAISDVPGDAPHLIASGPTVPPGSTPKEALAVLSRYSIEPGPAIRKVLENSEPSGPLPSPVHEFTVVASGRTMLAAARLLISESGYRVIDLGDELEGDACQLAAAHAGIARHLATAGEKCCVLSGGESTVTLKAPGGQGGRNTEYLLALAVALGGERGIWAMAGDSDGIDGRGKHAGALIGPDTLHRAQKLGLDAHACLEAHDSATFFEALKDLVVTGPTMTNVNDLRVILTNP